MKIYLFLLAALLHACVLAQGQIIRQDLRIPVRDGSTIAGDLYSTDTLASRPVILIQTPYNKNLYRPALGNGISGTVPYAPERYHYVIIDWRGFYGSSDAPAAGYDRGLDGYDIIQWIDAQTWCDGKVGTWGGSALGMIQFQTARTHPPQLVCAAPLIKDFKTKYGDYYFGGVLRREHVESLERLGFITVNLITSHPARDIVWRTAEQSTDYADEISVPMLLASGWFDHFPDDVMRAFSDLRERSDITVRDQHRLIMGPWTHSGVDRPDQGELSYPDAVNTVRDASLQFFDYYLLGAKNGWPLTPTLRYYELGGGWGEASSWNDVTGTTTRMYLHPDGSIRDISPEPVGGERVFSSDPRNPVPSHGSARFNPFDPTAVAGPLDINDAVLTHPDVLLFESPAMTEDLVIRGSLSAEMFVSTDRPDADVSVRICDVFPDGRRIIMSEGIRRLRFRDGYESESVAVPNTVYSLEIPMQDIAWRLAAGHRLAVAVCGASVPRFDVNPNTGGALYEPGDSLTATTRIELNALYPSSILLDIVQSASTVHETRSAERSMSLDAWPQPISRGSALNVSLHFDQPEFTRILLVDLLGRTVTNVFSGHVVPGTHRYTWSAPGTISPGLYFLRYSDSITTGTRPVIVE